MPERIREGPAPLPVRQLDLQGQLGAARADPLERRRRPPRQHRPRRRGHVRAHSHATTQLAGRWIPDQPLPGPRPVLDGRPLPAPEGPETAWAYTHVPQTAALGRRRRAERRLGREEEGERFADRMEAEVERLAPGFRPLILKRHAAVPPLPRGQQPQPGRRRDQRRHRPALPAGDLPPLPRARPADDAGSRPLPRLLLGPPRRRPARRARRQRGADRASGTTAFRSGSAGRSSRTSCRSARRRRGRPRRPAARGWRGW